MTKQREADRGNDRRTDAKSAFWGNPRSDRAGVSRCQAIGDVANSYNISHIHQHQFV